MKSQSPFGFWAVWKPQPFRDAGGAHTTGGLNRLSAFGLFGRPNQPLRQKAPQPRPGLNRLSAFGLFGRVKSSFGCWSVHESLNRLSAFGLFGSRQRRGLCPASRRLNRLSAFGLFGRTLPGASRPTWRRSSLNRLSAFGLFGRKTMSEKTLNATLASLNRLSAFGLFGRAARPRLATAARPRLSQSPFGFWAVWKRTPSGRSCSRSQTVSIAFRLLGCLEARVDVAE